MAFYTPTAPWGQPASGKPIHPAPLLLPAFCCSLSCGSRGQIKMTPPACELQQLASISETVFPGKRRQFGLFWRGWKAFTSREWLLIPLSVYLHSEESEEVGLAGQKWEESSSATVAVTTAQMSASKEPELPVTVETEWQWLTLLKHKHLDPPPQSKVCLWRSGDFNIEQNPDKGHISESWLYFSPPVFFSIFPCFCFSLLESPHVLAKMRRTEGREAEGKQAVWE